MSSSPAVVARGLRVARGQREVLHGLDFEIPVGRISGLIGPSGGGKTTLMRALVGVQRRVSGELLVLGQAPGSPAVRRRVGYVTQAPAVYEELTVEREPGLLRRARGRVRRAAA